MRQTEIAKKFDEIVDFAEVESFLDTPVKRYSSGMYTRLAFAVAANLEPEVLIVDEVLAVGDAEFQKKCLGKMKSVSDKEGRTVIFVSHNMVCAFESDGIQNQMTLKIDSDFLVRGNYSIHTFLHAARQAQFDVVYDQLSFEVNDYTSKFVGHGAFNYGSVFGKGEWL
jgi:lipopolysaccharide transport system ATP-binding protein